MAASSILAALAAEVGMNLAKRVVTNLGSKSNADSAFKKVDSLITSGTGALVALQKVFGKDFDSALSQAIPRRSLDWTYEAGRADYTVLDAVGGKPLTVLRAELNINLDRISRENLQGETEIRNYFIGVFREWMSRYRALVGVDDDAEQTFAAIESLLDGKGRTFAEVFRLFKQTGLGTLGALLVIQAVLIATSTGVGVVAAISTWLFGIPMLQVGALAVSGAVIFALSRAKVTSANALSASVAVAYKLLDRAENRSKTGMSAASSEA